ncbi:hypothetical protein [Blastococcus aggregatus]|nr:hypothetical protein [Blastococcus aggregatus]
MGDDDRSRSQRRPHHVTDLRGPIMSGFFIEIRRVRTRLGAGVTA